MPFGALSLMTRQPPGCKYSSTEKDWPHLKRRLLPNLAWIYNRLGISFMQVSKWGNSLAVRLPAVVVEALDLKEGDEIEISIAGKRDFKVARDRSKERALEQLRQMKWSFPRGFKFSREEINER